MMSRNGWVNRGFKTVVIDDLDFWALLVDANRPVRYIGLTSVLHQLLRTLRDQSRIPLHWISAGK